MELIREQAQPVTEEGILGHIRRRIYRRAPAFLSPMNLALPEFSQVAFMLEVLSNGFRGGEGRKVFFGNSHMEAVHGAIKAARHYVRDKDRGYGGDVLFLDPDRYYANYFNPLGSPEGEQLIPGILCRESAESLLPELQDRSIRILVISIRRWPTNEYQHILDHCRLKGIVTVLDTSPIAELSREALEQSLAALFDIVCWGEGLGLGEVPFGAFAVKEHVYAVWNNRRNCSLHSSTFGGNGMVLSYIKKCMIDLFPSFNGREGYWEILNGRPWKGKVKANAIRRYVNSRIQDSFRASGVPQEIVTAEGATLYADNGRPQLQEILDCIGGSGSNVFGHNREDLVSEVIDRHDPDEDHLLRLEEKMYRLTGLERTLQAVSGASAVEMALAMALLAAAGKKKILVFKGNFGGKTLAALNATTGNNNFFYPLYPHVIIFDPFVSGAPEKLRHLLSAGDIALVWMEIIQGRTLIPVPREIVELVQQLRKAGGYYIGIDEILNGLGRTGGFTSFDTALIRPDILTFAKGLSGLILPVSAVVCSQALYGNAVSANPEAVAAYGRMYVNQLTAHIATHELERLEKEDTAKKVREMSAYLENGFRKAVDQSKMVRKLSVYGLNIHFTVDSWRWPLRLFGPETANQVLTRLFLSKGHFLCLYGRLLPPLNLSREQADQLISGTADALSSSPLEFFWLGLRISVYRKSCDLRSRISKLISKTTRDDSRKKSTPFV